MTGCIAVLNAGSSSIKFALYDSGQRRRAAVSRAGREHRRRAAPAGRRRRGRRSWPSDAGRPASSTIAAPRPRSLQLGRELLAGRPVLAFGHRVVHGGTDFAAPVRVDAAVLAELAKLVPLAPLHQPHNLAPIEAIAAARAAYPAGRLLRHRVPSHASRTLAQAFALPRELTRRRRAPLRLPRPVLRLHRAAACARSRPRSARRRGWSSPISATAPACAPCTTARSVASTMGFTAVDGLMMGTRCGRARSRRAALPDGGARAWTPRGIEDLLYRQSGLLGVSGISSDMRTLRQSKAPEAAEAIALFVYRIVREIGSLAAALGGVDGLSSPPASARTTPRRAPKLRPAAAGWAWSSMPRAIGSAAGPHQRATGSRISAWVVPTDEERMIARYTSQAVET